MRCADAERFVSQRLDGRLAAGNARALDEHLAGCGACRRLAEQMAAAWDLLGAAPAPAPPTWANVLARLDARGRWRTWLATLGWRRPAFGLAAASLAAVVAVGIGGGVLLSGRLHAPPPVPSAVEGRFEAVALAEAFGELPAGSPAELLLGTIAAGHAGRQER